MPTLVWNVAYVIILLTGPDYFLGKAVANRFAPGRNLLMPLSPAVAKPDFPVTHTKKKMLGIIGLQHGPRSELDLKQNAELKIKNRFYEMKNDVAQVEDNLGKNSARFRSQVASRGLLRGQEHTAVSEAGKVKEARHAAENSSYAMIKICLGGLAFGMSIVIFYILNTLAPSNGKSNHCRTSVPEMKARGPHDAHAGGHVSDEVQVPDDLVASFQPKPRLQPSSAKDPGDLQPNEAKDSAPKWCTAAELFHGARQPRGHNALHRALNKSDCVTAGQLIADGDEFFLNQQTALGITPLMLLAMGYCEEELIWKLLERRGDASVAAYSTSRRTAADYAEEANNRSARIVDTLRKLEMVEKQQTAMYRCPVCRDTLTKRPKLVSYAERSDRGEEDNMLLKSFFSNGCHMPLLQPCYHEINNMSKIRKELAESLAMLEAVDSNIPGFDGRWHVVDLCCSKAITSLLVTLRHPGVTVSAVDILEPRFVPHFAPEQDSIRYTQLDVMGDSFLAKLESLIAAASRPTVLLGIHLCGNLSLRAIEAFHRIASVQALILSPCCLPAKDGRYSEPAPSHVYDTIDGADQYELWARHLEDTLRNAVEDASVTHQRAPEMLSPKNIILSATRSSAKDT